jgi:hypothetical protein
VALAKLSEQQRAEIRQKYAAGDTTQRQLASQYGVAQCTVRRVLFPEAVKIVQHNWEADNPEKRRRMYNNRLEKSLLYTSRRRGWAHNISLEDVCIPDRCPVYGIRLDRHAPPGAPNRPSIDRVDNTLGYVKGNVRIISWAANKDKHDLTECKLRLLLNYVENHKAGLL